MKTNIYAPFWIIKAALSHLQSGSVIMGTTLKQVTDPSPDLYDYAQTTASVAHATVLDSDAMALLFPVRRKIPSRASLTPKSH